MPTLSIQLPGLPPVSHVLKDETITIGRMKGNTIVIEDSSISLMHAKITRRNGDFLLKDLNSTNGTSVNGQPIGEVRLKDQDRVRFAEITCQFLADAAVPGEQPPAVAIAPAPTAAAPILVSPTMVAPASPSPQVATAAPAPKAKPKKRASSLPTVLRYASAVVAVGVVSLIAWRLFQVNQEGSTNRDNSPAKATLAALPQALTQGRPQPIASKRLNDSKVSEASSATPNQSPLASTLAENKIEPSAGRVPQLIQALKSRDTAERQRAAETLHSLGADAKEAVPALREALKDDDHDVQMWAALALVNNQDYDKRVIPVLIRVLQNDNPVLRQVACLSLGLIPYLESEKETVIPPLTETANKDTNDEVRQAAFSALSILAPETVGKTAAK